MIGFGKKLGPVIDQFPFDPIWWVDARGPVTLAGANLLTITDRVTGTVLTASNRWGGAANPTYTASDATMGYGGQPTIQFGGAFAADPNGVVRPVGPFMTGASDRWISGEAMTTLVVCSSPDNTAWPSASIGCDAINDDLPGAPSQTPDSSQIGISAAGTPLLPFSYDGGLVVIEGSGSVAANTAYAQVSIFRGNTSKIYVNSSTVGVATGNSGPGHGWFGALCFGGALRHYENGVWQGKQLVTMGWKYALNLSQISRVLSYFGILTGNAWI